MRRFAPVLAVLAIAATLVASATAAVRLQRYAVKGQGVSVAVPWTWVVVDAKFPAPVIESVAQQNPQLAPYIHLLQAPNSPIKFFALDPAVENGFATNVNIVVGSSPAGLSFDTFQRGVVAQLQATLPGTKIAKKVVTIGGSRAVQLRYRLHLTVGRTFTVQTLQYAFLRRGRSVIFTYTTLPQTAKRHESAFARSAASIRFSRP